MSNFVSNLFVTIPLFATLCNLFLLLTFLGAKKDHLIRAFTLLLISLTMWPLASLFMRLSLRCSLPSLWRTRLFRRAKPSSLWASAMQSL